MRYLKSWLLTVFFLAPVGLLKAQLIAPANMPKTEKAPMIALAYNDIEATYLDSVICLEYSSNVDFEVTSRVPWLKVDKIQKNNIFLSTLENPDANLRKGQLALQQVGGTYSATFNITQQQNNVASTIKGDIKVKVAGGIATASNPGEGIEKSFDGNYTTMYHSPYSSGQLPVTLTYNFTNISHIDYMVYNPRRGGGSNGNFDEIEVYYTLQGSTNRILVGSYKLGGSGEIFTLKFAEPLVNPKNVIVVVKSGYGGFASCAEMEFYQINPASAAMFSMFEDAMCTKLKSNVTDADIEKITNLFAKKLAKEIKAGTYNTEFRVDHYEPYPLINEVASQLRTSGYDQYENPTGIYFNKGQDVVIFVDNPGEEKVSLKIKYWTNSTTEGEGSLVSSSYTLKNGMNKIVAQNSGHGYINYYTANWATAPKVGVHVAFGDINGCFNLAKYKKADGTIDRPAAAAAWKRILANVKSTMFDVYGEFHHAVYPTAEFRKQYPNDGVDFALAYDSIVWYEQEIVGLMKYGRRPKNHMFSRTSLNGSMAAGGEGAVIPNPGGGYVNIPNLDWWGVGHELGHVNQIRPALKWLSTTEVTNNIYSAYVQHKLGNGPFGASLGAKRYYRLESEGHGGDDVRNGVGGRFNAYLNYGIKDGSKWLMTEGPDYYGSTPAGNPASRNYDHFVKLSPFWNMVLYFKECGVRPELWYQLGEMARTYPTAGKSDGELQLNFMRAAMDSAKINMIPFFEKVGMLREYNNYLADYTSGWMIITKAQIDQLKTYIENKNYPMLETPVMYYICANNWETYRDKAALDITYKSDGSGDAEGTSRSGTYVTCDHASVKNAVAFETYDAEGKLLRITMKGFRNAANTSTQALFPAGSKTVKAIGWDGESKVIYTAK